MTGEQLSEVMMGVLDSPVSVTEREKEVTPHERKIVVKSLERALEA